jgi:hypothetical protein
MRFCLLCLLKFAVTVLFIGLLLLLGDIVLG